LQMEIILLGNGKKEWEMAGVDMYRIKNQTNNRVI
jgi:hypothetical protein